MSEQSITEISLSHGQAKFVLWDALAWWKTEGQEPEPWLDSYIKYLRLAGCPFSEGELGCGHGGNVLYKYEHLMELGVALLLRGSGIAKIDVAYFLAKKRDMLRPIYRQASLERSSGIGEKTLVSAGGTVKYNADVKHFVDNSQYLKWHEGVFIDLGAEYIGSKLAFTSEPKAIGPTGAIDLLTHQRCFFGIIALSQLADRIVGASQRVPNIRRGRQ